MDKNKRGIGIKYTGDFYRSPNGKIIKYISERRKYLLDKISKHDRIILVSPTNSGKTTFFINETEELLKRFNRVIFVMPLLSIQSELSTNWNADLDVNGSLLQSEIDEKFQSTKRITSTFRSLHNRCNPSKGGRCYFYYFIIIFLIFFIVSGFSL